MKENIRALGENLQPLRRRSSNIHHSKGQLLRISETSMNAAAPYHGGTAPFVPSRSWDTKIVLINSAD